MRVANLSYCLSDGGLERIVSILSTNFSSDIEQYLITYFDDVEYEHNAKHISLNLKRPKTFFGKLLLNFKAQRKLKQLKLELNLDTCISHGPGPNIINVKSKVFEKTILTEHCNRTMEDSRKGIRTIILKRNIKKYYNKSNVVVSVSREVADDLILNYGVEKSKIKVIHNPIEIRKINESIPINNFFSSEHFNIISAGRLTYQKNHELMIDVINKLKDSIPNVRLYIFGRGELYDSLQQKINLLNLSDFVILEDFKTNIYSYMKSADLFLFTSRFEGFGNVIVEAMACGCPIVSTNCKSGPKEILLENGIKFGELIDNDIDVQLKICEVITNLCNNTEQLNKFSELGLKRSKDFSTEIVLKKWENLIKYNIEISDGNGE